MIRALMIAAGALALTACGQDETVSSTPDNVEIGSEGTVQDAYGGTTVENVPGQEGGRSSAATGASDPASNNAAGEAGRTQTVP